MLGLGAAERWFELDDRALLLTVHGNVEVFSIGQPKMRNDGCPVGFGGCGNGIADIVDHFVAEEPGDVASLRDTRSSQHFGRIG